MIRIMNPNRKNTYEKKEGPDESPDDFNSSVHDKDDTLERKGLLKLPFRYRMVRGYHSFPIFNFFNLIVS